ncbi:MAG: PfkB family carbohydrate kinase [Jatrophihabitantaceae bacterium]
MGQLTPSVTVVGSLNLDLVVGVPALPGRGETVVGTSVQELPGGKGANQAAAAAALSSSVAMIGRVGDDSAGRWLVEELVARGVASSVHVTAGVPTGTATVAVEDGSGENLIVVAPGANGAVTPDDVRIDVVRDAAVVLVQLEIPLDAVDAALSHAGGLAVLNPAPPCALPATLLSRVDVLVPNEWELARLASVAPIRRSTGELIPLARSVTPGDVVVTMGARGALVVPRSGAPSVVPPPAVDVVDTTGAGDCFCGALCVALAGGVSLVDAARYAVTAAALSTAGVGARGGLPDDAAVRALLG